MTSSENAKTVPKVFVASSSEGLDVVRVVHQLLERDLNGTVDVIPWTEEFQLTKVYIESLERLLDTSDFAVIVFTPDDRNNSREVEKMSPRDNVVFELGLFFGRLGRERCFLIQRRDFDLKIPSDLLGIEPAGFSMGAGQKLIHALAPACKQIGKAIRERKVALPSRPKLSEAERAIQSTIRSFADKVAGTWWERIQLNREEPALSFVTIELDDVHSSVRLSGKAYSNDGAHVANWRSAAAHLDKMKIVYVRECERLDTKTTVWLPGLGEVNFDNSEAIEQGDGKFWESNEDRPEETVIKRVQLRRNHNNGHTIGMRKGSEKERAVLVREILGNW
jgi:hypothetical protein